jgi:hypothetical protein
MITTHTVALSLLFAIGSTSCSAGSGDVTGDEGPPVATEGDAVRNGTSDSSNQYAAVVQIVMHPDLLTTRICSGTIVSPTRVLTAAHCLVNGFGARVYYNGGSQTPTTIRFHPLFKIPETLWAVQHQTITGGITGVTDGPDLATVDVAQPLPIAPRALGGVPQFGQSLTVAGYGLIATNVPAPGLRFGTELVTTLLPMIRGGTPRLNAGSVVVTAGPISAIGCAGDSGAPLFDGAGQLVAVTSVGVGDCSSSPNNSAVVVSPYKSWILETGTPLPYHNYKLPVDVNDDGFVTTADSQMILDTLNAGGSLSSAPPGYRDAYPDSLLSGFDLITVINATSQTQATGFTISPR